MHIEPTCHLKYYAFLYYCILFARRCGMSKKQVELVSCITLFTLLAPLPLLAKTTLYACMIKGHTTLESRKRDDCDKLVEYNYPTYDKGDHGSQRESVALNSGHPHQAKAIKSAMNSSLICNEEKAVDRISQVAVNEYDDGRVDKCAHFKAELNSALLYIAAKNSMDIEIGPYRAAELATVILHAQPQINYYCEKSYT